MDGQVPASHYSSFSRGSPSRPSLSKYINRSLAFVAFPILHATARGYQHARTEAARGERREASWLERRKEGG